MDWKVFLIIMAVVSIIPLILYFKSLAEIASLKKKVSCLITENGNLFEEKTKLQMEAKFYRGVYETTRYTNEEAEKKLLNNIDNWDPFDPNESLTVIAEPPDKK